MKTPAKLLVAALLVAVVYLYRKQPWKAKVRQTKASLKVFDSRLGKIFNFFNKLTEN